MTAENWVLSCLAGFVMGWLANAITRGRYSIFDNLFVGIIGAILCNIVLRALELSDGKFFFTLGFSFLGSGVLLGLYHVTRHIERRN